MKSKLPILILSVVAAITVVGIIAGLGSRENIIPRSKSETLSIINSATAIETYRIKLNGPFGSETIGGFPVVGKGLIPDQATSKQLKAIFVAHLRGESDTPQKGCPPPEPGVAIRFIKDKDSVDILLCFRCHDLLVVNDVSPKWRDFTPQRNALVKIAKGIFPDDTEIQKLQDVY